MDELESFCSDCDGVLCKFCSQAHQRIKAYQSHITWPVADVPPTIPTKKATIITCRTHPRECLNIYCKTCHMLVCCECLVANHQSHKLATVNDETRQNVQEEIVVLLSQSCAKLRTLVDAKEYIESVEANVLEMYDQLKKTISARYEAVFDTLRKKQKDQLEMTDDMCNSHLKGIWAEKDYVVRTSTSIQSAIDLAERNFKCGNVELLRMSTHILSRLKELNEVHWDESPTEKVEFNRPHFKFNSFNFDVGNVETSMYPRSRTTLSIGNIPTELSLATTLNVTVHQCIRDGQLHPIGFQLPSVGASVTYGATKKTLSDAHVKVNKKSWGKWEVSFTPVCGGAHELRIFVIGNEESALSHTIKVVGRPWINARVSKGPDYGEQLCKPPDITAQKSKPATDGQVDYYSCYVYNVAVEGRVRNSYYPFGRHNKMILVEWDVGGSCCTYRWGADDYYDIELLL